MKTHSDRILSAGHIIMALLVVGLPFTIELFIWGIIDTSVYLGLTDIVLMAAMIVTFLLFSLIIFRSWRQAVALAFSVLSGLIMLIKAKNFAGILWPGKGRPPLLVRWGPAFFISILIGYLLFRIMESVMTHKWSFLALSFLSSGLCFSSYFLLNPLFSVQRAHELPDIVLIVMDTTRADHLSVYGYPRHTTPCLEWISREGVVYENAFSPASWTPPGHASLFTGLLPSVHGTDGDSWSFDPPGPSLAEALRASGYRTAAVMNNPQLASSLGWSRGFEFYHETWTPPKPTIPQLIWMLEKRSDDWIWRGDTKRTMRIARRWWNGRPRNPRFLFLNLIDPHSPYGDNHSSKDMFLDDITRKAPEISNDSEDYDSGLLRAQGPALKRVIAGYDGDIRYMDSCLESFLRWLKGRGELDHTLIAITSDHGERLGEKGLLGHQLGLDRVLLHVPLILRYPQKLGPKRAKQLVQTHGLYMTILNLVGKKAIGDQPARMPALDDQKLSVVVAQMRHQGEYLNSLLKRNPTFDTSPFAGDWASASEGDWKLHRSNAGTIHLYNLLDDPAEEKDIAAAHPDVVKRLIPFIKGLPECTLLKKDKEVPADLKDLLRSLGYIR
jgi:arylsulfatase A-like enzyme